MEKQNVAERGVSRFGMNAVFVGHDGFLKSKYPVRRRVRFCLCGKKLANGNSGKECFTCRPGKK